MFNMMHMDFIWVIFLIPFIATIFTRIVISCEDSISKLAKYFSCSSASWYLLILFGKLDRIKIFRKPIWVKLFFEIPMFFPRLKTHSRKSGTGFFGETFVPNGLVPKLVLSVMLAMTPFVFGVGQAAAFVGWERCEYFSASTLANCQELNPLLFGNSHEFSPFRDDCADDGNTGKLENQVNCWNTLRAINTTAYLATESATVKKVMDWAISSQVSWEQDKGSTTRLYDPERIMKAHECLSGNVRYSLDLCESTRSPGLNSQNGNKCPYTGKLDDLSEQPVKEVVRGALKNDCKKALDSACATQFALTPLRVAPTAGTATDAVTLTTNGTATLTNNVGLGSGHVKAIVDTMKERNIPAYTDDDYYCIAWPSTLRPLKNDIEAVHQYTQTGLGHIMRGEVGRYEGTRFVEQTNVLKTAMSTAAAEWSNSLSNWAFFFGEDTVAEAVAVEEEIRGKLPGDYGRDKGVAWYALLGYGLVHTAADQSRIVMWDSAA